MPIAILFQRTNSYQVYDQAEAKIHMDRCVKELQNELGLPESVCYKVLNRAGWHSKKALEIAQEDSSLYDEMLLISANPSNKDSFDCPVCWDTVKTADGASLPCGHGFCKNCFRGHLENAVRYDDNAFYLTCPQSGCKVIPPLALSPTFQLGTYNRELLQGVS